MSSPCRISREKLSLRKRLFVKKSTRVGCTDSDSREHDDSSSPARPASPNFVSDPFLARSSSAESNISPDKDKKQTFRQSRPHSLIEGHECASNKELIIAGASSTDCVYDVPVAIVNFPKINDFHKKNTSLDHADLFGKCKCESFEKRLSADQLISSDAKRLSTTYPEDDKSSSLDRKASRCGKRDGAGTGTRWCRAGSADSLARHSLLAAQVLRLIPTQEARERNFLYGGLASNWLLGASELEHVFPDRQVTIFVGTWNMNGQPPPRELKDFVLPAGVRHVADVLAVGTQESCPERTEWEVCVQEILGPSHVLLHSAYLGTLHLTVWVRRDLVWFCSLPEDASLSVRPGAAFRTKGAVGISLALFGSTLLFVTAHLTAHQEKVKERVADIKRITRSLHLPRNIPVRHKSKDVTNNFDYVFWFGDLNFRLGEPRAAVLRWIQETQFPLPSNLPHGLLHADQLTAVLEDGAAFRDFCEAPITFPPTYKYDPGSQQFDTSSKQRTPAYTDRILYKTRNLSAPSSTFSGLRRGSGGGGGGGGAGGGAALRCTAYSSVSSVCSSDHKPVWALFTATLRPGTDVVPLAAGLFNREVYLAGLRRRADTQRALGLSAVCSLQ